MAISLPQELFVHKYGAKNVSNFCNISSENLRDWRRRGLLDEYGDNSNGHWAYSHEDVIAFCIFEQEQKNVISSGVEVSLAFGKAMARPIIWSLLVDYGQVRFSTLYTNNDGEIVGKTFSEIGDFPMDTNGSTLIIKHNNVIQALSLNAAQEVIDMASRQFKILPQKFPIPMVFNTKEELDAFFSEARA